MMTYCKGCFICNIFKYKQTRPTCFQRITKTNRSIYHLRKNAETRQHNNNLFVDVIGTNTGEARLPSQLKGNLIMEKQNEKQKGEKKTKM